MRATSEELRGQAVAANGVGDYRRARRLLARAEAAARAQHDLEGLTRVAITGALTALELDGREAAERTLQEAREACGGAGFLFENRLVGLRQDLDIYVTFEGDNNVLLQLVAKRLLTDYAKRFKNADAGAMARANRPSGTPPKTIASG